MIGSVGGTFGMFIGFSFSNFIISIIEYIPLLRETIPILPLTPRKKLIRSIWKCLKWIIYLSLLAIAILFAEEVIEKFFCQSTGIKQNMDKIDLQPSITICPFLYSPYEGKYYINPNQYLLAMPTLF